jgi:hypothetical protein
MAEVRQVNSIGHIRQATNDKDMTDSVEVQRLRA